MRHLAKRIWHAAVPAAIRQRLHRLTARSWLRGDYATWAEARAASAGYDAPDELALHVAAVRAVEAGRGAWERDGHVFAEPATNEPLLAALRAVAARQGGRLDVVDFGGALGSTWRQHRAVLADLAEVRWRVVEQPAWVEAGRREFANEALTFHASLAEAAVAPERQVLLCSCALQYLEEPQTVLAAAVAASFGEAMLERVALWEGARDRLTVQRTPAELGGGSYPCWVFRRETLLAPWGRDYELAAEWESFGEVAAWVTFRSFHFVRAGRGA